MHPIQPDDRPLRIEVDQRPGHTVVRAHGDVDASTSPLLERAIRTCCSEGRDVQLDLRHVDFIDSGGLHVLIAARQQYGPRFTVGALSPAAERLLALTGMADFVLDGVQPDSGTTGGRPTTPT